MRATIFEHGRFSVGQLKDPAPGAGQVLVKPLVCGVCGSDLHACLHPHQLAGAMVKAGFDGFMNPDKPVVLGHEFVCEVVDYGADCTKTIERGQRVVALPFLMGEQGIELLGFSNHNSGGMAEAMLLQEQLMFAVPDQVPTDIAALTEPLAVAVHAVSQSGANGDCAFAVHGCGPVGLFIIARLRHLGLGPILAVDPDLRRRAHAEHMGADMVIAPDDEAVKRWWRQQGAAIGMSDAAAAGPSTRRAVVFECVGKPDMLQAVAWQSPMNATLMVVGVCMQDDVVSPSYLLMKETTLRFVFAYSANDFAEAFAMICAAPDALAPLITGYANLTDVEDVFTKLRSGGEHVKVLIRAEV